MTWAFTVAAAAIRVVPVAVCIATMFLLHGGICNTMLSSLVRSATFLTIRVDFFLAQVARNAKPGKRSLAKPDTCTKRS